MWPSLPRVFRRDDACQLEMPAGHVPRAWLVLLAAEGCPIRRSLAGWRALSDVIAWRARCTAGGEAWHHIDPRHHAVVDLGALSLGDFTALRPDAAQGCQQRLVQL